jgi:carbamoyl-phosphate synthase small subunit
MAAVSPPARVILEDGAVFSGRSFGAEVDAAGEVVFCTAMTGYQEALTDPSYRGQILTLTAAHIGNYGVCGHDVESAGPQVAGFVVREASAIRSNCRSERDLGAWLTDRGVPAVTGIDTRALVRRLRGGGAMRGMIVVGDSRSSGDVLETIRSQRRMSGQDLASEAGTASPGSWTESIDCWWPAPAQPPETPYRVVAIDCGAKRNIYRHLVAAGCQVRTVPVGTTAAAVLAMEPEGVFVSNGPGDPAAVTAGIETLKGLIGHLPMFGICLGHQLLALALGASTWKLPFGHRGANQPVRDLEADRIFITSQNHGFCVDGESLEQVGCRVTHVHLNDGTVAGFRHETLPIHGLQFHPEASPGPHESASLFGTFTREMSALRGGAALAGEAS